MKRLAFRHSTHWYKLSAVCLLLLASVPAALEAQSYYGGVRGVVLDQNGGAVANAKVTLIDAGSNTQRAALTTSSGEFVFSEVIPGTYTIVAEAPGFKKFESTASSSARSSRYRWTAKLELGQVTESMR